MDRKFCGIEQKWETLINLTALKAALHLSGLIRFSQVKEMTENASNSQDVLVVKHSTRNYRLTSGFCLSLKTQAYGSLLC